MPTWATYIVIAAAVVTASSVLWIKLIRPLANLITMVGKLLPLLTVLTDTFKDNPDAFKVLEEIASEFRTNDGSSLKDQVNRIEQIGVQATAVAEAARVAADELKVGVEARRLMAEQDRKQMQDLMLKLDRVNETVKNGAATGLRVEAQQTLEKNEG